MVQALWYVRRADQTRGPYPGPQIEEALRNGDLEPTDEISLDGAQWQAIGDGGIVRAQARPVATSKPAAADAAWQAERDKARQRWEDGNETRMDSPTPMLDAVRMQSLRLDQAETRAMLDARARGKPSLFIALAAILVLALVGSVVWYGQEGEAIQAGIGKAGDCAADATPGSSWAGCDKRGLVKAGADLHSMTLRGARLDGAQLSGANLSYANLSRATLRSANLANANLLGANLDDVDLSGADLSNADLRYATLNRSKLDGARLDGARVGKTTWVGGALCESLEACR
jgi:hypothetical protein